MIDAYDIAVRLATGKHEMFRIYSLEACAVPPPPRPAPDAQVRQSSAELAGLLRQAAAASLVGGMIAASGRAHTTAEAVALMREVLEALA